MMSEENSNFQRQQKKIKDIFYDSLATINNINGLDDVTR